MTFNEPVSIAALSDHATGPWGEDLIPDTIIPEQWSWARPSVATASPEARLMISVLDDAISRLLYLRGQKAARARQEREELERWFASPDASWLFSFESICATLNMSSAGIREMVATWKTAPPAATGTRRRRIRTEAARTRVLGAHAMRKVA